MTKPLLLLNAGEASERMLRRHGDIPAWFLAVPGIADADLQIIDIFRGEALPDPAEARGAIITGSPAMVSHRAPWSEWAAAWIRDAMAIDLPLFGVCFGHQLITHALGGRIGPNPNGREIGNQRIEMRGNASDDPLSKLLPPSFRAMVCHLETVLEPAPGTASLASSERDAHQIIRYGQNALSVQFHPEITPGIMATFIDDYDAGLRSEGLDPARLKVGLAPAEEAMALLSGFVRAVSRDEGGQDASERR